MRLANDAAARVAGRGADGPLACRFFAPVAVALAFVLMIPDTGAQADKAAAPANRQPQPQATQSQPTPDQVAQAAAAAQQHKLAIEAEKARCTAMLAGLAINATLKDPIEEGECGALAPVELVSVGKKPEVVMSPPAIVTCDLARELAGWVKDDVQPLARQYLSEQISKIEVMSAYSCRHAYNRVRNKLSEHGRANALDIRGFVTEKGVTAYVLEDWGMTSSEIAAASAAAQKEQAARAETERQLAASKAAAEAARSKTAAKEAGKDAGGTQASSSSGITNPLSNATTIIEGLPPQTSQVPAMALSPSSHLGGPKAKAAVGGAGKVPPTQKTATTGSDQPPTAKSLFLRAVHDRACLRFGTTLGPEANADHRNHLHVDMAERKVRKICDK